MWTVATVMIISVPKYETRQAIVISQSLLEVLPKIVSSSLSSHLFGQKEPKLSQILLTSAFVADKCSAIQYKFMQCQDFSYMSDENRK